MKDIPRPNPAKKTNSDELFYLDVLSGTECFCGNDKLSGKALCWKCFKALPGRLQNNLYQKPGRGFEAAYEEAVGWLDD